MSNFLKNTLCVLASLGCIALLELTLRLAFPAPPPSAQAPSIFTRDSERDKSFLVEYDENLGYRLKDTGDAEEFVDSSGRAFRRAKPQGVYRIVCVGGSTTYGVGAEAGRSYPAILQEILSFVCEGSGARLEVLNAGVMGYHSWHSALRTSLELDALQPDLYVLMDAVNDFYASQTVANPSALEDEKEALLALVNSRDKTPGLAARAAALLDDLAVYRLMKALYRQSLAKREATVPERLERFGYKSNMARIIEDKRRLGIDVVLVDYPWIHNFINPDRTYRNYPYRIDARMMAEASRYFHAANNELKAKYGVAVVDMQPLFNSLVDQEPNINRLYTDNVHLSKLANFFVAQAVAETVRSTASFARAMPACGRTLHDSGHPLLKLYNWGRQIGPYGWQTLDRAIPTRTLSRTDLGEVPDSGLEGWSYQYPVAAPGVVRLAFRPTDAVRTDGAVRCFFYPRIVAAGSGSVAVAQLLPDGGERQVFLLDPSNEDAVQCAQSYFFDVADIGEEIHLEISLNGESQVWHHDGRYLFQIPPHN